MSNLTTTQSSALATLRERGSLVAFRTAWDSRGIRQFSRRTLQALVDAGYATWNSSDYIVERQITADAKRFTTGYMDLAFDDLSGLLGRAEKHLAGVDFDTLVGTGFSGAAIVPALALRLGKKYILVRKPKDGSHHNGPMIGQLGKRWLFIDDFVASGKTRRRVINAIETACKPNAYRLTAHETEYVGDYHYARLHGASYSERGDYLPRAEALQEGWE